MAVTYDSVNPLPASDRARMVEELNGFMAVILDNHYQSLLAHWNTRGPNFKALHDLFEAYAGSNGAENWCDWVAERISQLGGTVCTTVQFIAARSPLDEYPVDITDGSDHVRALVAALAVVLQRARDGRRLAESIDDTVTSDILISVQRSGEKFLWLLEAHIPQRQ